MEKGTFSMSQEQYEKFIGKDVSDVTTLDKLLVVAGIAGTIYVMRSISVASGDKRGFFSWLVGKKE